MRFSKKIFLYMYKYLSDYRFRFEINQGLHINNHLDDKTFLKKCFRAYMGSAPDIDNPQTFNEKLQWLKLYNRQPEYSIMVDKYRVREYIAQMLGEEYLIPLLGVWNNPNEVDFNTLPNKFVLKCNHNSGRGMCICKDKSALDIEFVKRQLQEGLDEDYYALYREWPYKNVPRRIIAEKFMQNADGSDLQDYKIHCFNGTPRFILVCKDRFSDSGLTEDFFDVQWKHMFVARPNHPNSSTSIPAPQNLGVMLDFARKLACDIPFIRVDFYEISGKVYFGELTFFPASGLEKFEPDSWDKRFGDWLDLSAVEKTQ